MNLNEWTCRWLYPLEDPKPTVTPKFSLSVINTKNKARTLYSTTF